jgi:hypothetical protein
MFLASMALLLGLPATARAQTWEFVGTVIDDVRGEALGEVEIFTPDGRKLGESQDEALAGPLADVEAVLKKGDRKPAEPKKESEMWGRP